MVIEQRSLVEASAEQVWDRVVTPEGINDEMRPWMTMSAPRGQVLNINNVDVGVVVRAFFAHRHRRLARYFATGAR